MTDRMDSELEEAKRLAEHAQSFIILLRGIRGTGKTRLAKRLFPDFRYVSCRSVKTRNLAQNAPEAFHSVYGSPVIIDDCEKAPRLIELEAAGAESRKLVLVGNPGHKELQKLRSGSRSLFMEIELTPVPEKHEAFEELIAGSKPQEAEIEIAGLACGALPSLNGTPPGHESDFWSDWTAAFMEETAESLLRVNDPESFYRFMKSAAAASGREINMSEIARGCGKTSMTVAFWLQALSDACVIHELRPLKTVHRRPVKRSKALFADPGLAAYLLDAAEPGVLSRSPFLTGLMINEAACGLSGGIWGDPERISYYRDSNNVGIDLIYSRQGILHPISAASTEEQLRLKMKHFGVLEKLGENRSAGLMLVSEPELQRICTKCGVSSILFRAD